MKSIKKDIRNGHIGMENIDFSIVPPASEPTTIPEASIQYDKILDTIFAVDSTGYPDPSGVIQLQRSTDPAVRQYISDTLLYKINGSSSVDDPDTALSLCQLPSESSFQYSERIVDYVKSQIEKKGD